MLRRSFIMAGAALACLPEVACAQSQSDFNAWILQTEAEAQPAGITLGTLGQIREGLALDQSLVGRISTPETDQRVSRYVQNLLNQSAAIARRKRAQNAEVLDGVARRHGVPASIQTAFWGRESGFGAVIGNKDVFSTCATLGSAGKTGADWRREYIAAATILQRKERTRSLFKGSFGAAIGQTQLLPSSYLAFGEDYDGDGKIDVWGSVGDALASAARHVQNIPAPLDTPPEGGKWRRGASWLEPVALPARPDFSRVEVDETRLTPDQWDRWGLRRLSGRPWGAVDADQAAALALPAGIGGPAFLMFPNFSTIETYNPSRTYALAVALLARDIDGAPPVAWPDEALVSLDDRKAAQMALQRLGFYNAAIDGDFGGGSRKALRAWQRSVGITPDGYITTAQARQLAGR